MMKTTFDFVSNIVSHARTFYLLAVTALLLVNSPVAAVDHLDDDEEFAITAVEALVSAPPERALPLARKALRSNFSDEVKSRALFVLSQIDHPDAQALIFDTVRNGEGELQHEAIRMLGISGKADSLTLLRDLYPNASQDMREAIIEAYIIADDEESVYQLAVNASSEDEFESAVEALGVRNARVKLRQLLESRGVSGSLIDAYAISGDADALRQLAMDDSDPEQQAKAIEALGIVGGKDVDATLLEIYKSANSDRVRSAALEGMMISGYDEGVLTLYRASSDASEKRELLEFLVAMGSDDVWAIVDEALDAKE